MLVKFGPFIFLISSLPFLSKNPKRSHFSLPLLCHRHSPFSFFSFFLLSSLMFLSPFFLHTHAPHPSQQYHDYQLSPAVMLLIEVVSLSLSYFFYLFFILSFSLSHLPIFTMPSLVFGYAMVCSSNQN